MMKNKLSIKIFAAVLCFTFPRGPLIAAEEPFLIRDIRTLGMGGAFTAVPDDANAFFYNPASIPASQKTHLTVFQTAVGISDDLKNGYDWYKDNQDDIDNMDKLKDSDPEKYNQLMTDVINTVSKLRITAEINTPQFSIIAPGRGLSFGMGIFTQANVLAKVNPGILFPTVDIHGRGDGIVPLTFGKRFLKDRLAVGITSKMLLRKRIDETRLTFLEMENYDPDIRSGSGWGMDIGAIYRLTEKLNFGAAAMDFGGFGGTKIKYNAEWTTPKSTSTPPALIPAYTGRITSSLNVGVAYRMNDFLLFSLDVCDVWRTKNNVVWGTTLWPKVHAGCELNFFDFLTGRLGINQGYPTFGFGINFWLFNVEYARWADELGIYAGDWPEWKQKLALTFKHSWGGKKEEPKEEVAPEIKAPEPEPEQEKINVAVTDFEAREPLSASDAAFISDFVRSDIVNSGGFNVVEKNNMDKILAEQGFQNSGCSSSDCAVAMGKILNVKSIIVGSCGKLLGKHIITLNVIDIESSKIQYSDNISIDNPDNIRDEISKLVERFVSKK